MKITVTEGCICDALEIDDKDYSEYDRETVKKILHKLIDRSEDDAILQDTLRELVKSDSGVIFTDLGHCEQCGDSIWKSEIEIDAE